MGNFGLRTHPHAEGECRKRRPEYEGARDTEMDSENPSMQNPRGLAVTGEVSS